ncbi:MAG: autotransporter-associated beta strand repeat-containing protein [Lentimonas sp.]
MCTAAVLCVSSSWAALPVPWDSRDVGVPTILGTADESAGTFTMTAGGTDIWSSADEFYYMYQPIAGDCEIITRVESVFESNEWAKAGVMIRESLDADSKNAIMAVRAGNGLTFQRRAGTAGSTVSTKVGVDPSVDDYDAPYWVRLVRSGDDFSAYYSPDGGATGWTQLGTTQTISMSSIVYIGLELSSRDDGVEANAVFTNVTVNATPAPRTAVTVNSIAELQSYVGSEFHDVTMTPGTYWLSGPSTRPAPSANYAIFLDLSGRHSSFNFTGVHIKVDTQELDGYGRTYGHDSGVQVLQVSGEGVEVDGLTLSMEKLTYDGVDQFGNPREYSADWSSQLVRVVGSNTTIRNCDFTTGGSYPYGYGDAFGKGNRPNTDGVTNAAFIGHSKQSGFLITGGATDVTVDNVQLNMLSFGHGFFMQQGASNILFNNSRVLGDAMADSDDIIAHPEYQEWGFATYKEPIPADINISKHEGAIRVYGNPSFATNGYRENITNITVQGCRIERMRTGIACAVAAGFLRVSNTEIYDCEYGYAPSNNTVENTFVNCKGNALNGPLIFFQYGISSPVTMEMELTGTVPGKGTWPIALVGGADSDITLTSSALPGVYPAGAYFNVSQKFREWRHRPSGDLDDGTSGYSGPTTNTKIRNLTDQILVFGPNATGNIDCESTGGVINKGTNNSYVGTTLVPSSIVIQDTWTSPTNPLDVSWAQFDGNGVQILPTAPYVVFSGTHVVNESLAFGGENAGDSGTVVIDGATLEVESGFSSQGETITISGNGTLGQGAIYSDGATSTATRLGSSTGDIVLDGNASIGVGVSGNQLLIGVVSGHGTLTKRGLGKLSMERSANTFTGALIVEEGIVGSRANKVPNDLVVASGARFQQISNNGLNQPATATTTLDGILDLNARGVTDGNSLSMVVGTLTGAASGQILSTSTAAAQILNVTSNTTDGTFAGTIEGRIALVKSGSAKLTLTGANTNSEPTSIDGGVLAVNGSLSALSEVTVNAGGALAGTGVVGGAVTLNDGGAVAPGNHVGELTSGAQTWNAGGVLEVEMNDATGSAGGLDGWDLMTVNGQITIDGSVSSGTPFIIELDGLGSGGESGGVANFDNRVSYTWLIASASGVTGSFDAAKFAVDASGFTVNNELDDGQFLVSRSGGDLYLNFTPSPYAAWKLGQEIPVNVAASDDYHGFGFPLLLEYGLELLPGETGGLPTLIPGSGSGFEFSFNRARADVIYKVYTSPSLLPESWTLYSTNPGTVGEWVEVTYMPAIDEEQMFFRLNVDRTAP